MKKKLALLLAAALLLSVTAACGVKPAEKKEDMPSSVAEALATPTPEVTPEPAPAVPAPTPTPTWELASGRVDGVGATYATLTRGELVEVIGEDGDYYVIHYGDLDLYVEKYFIRLSNEPAFSSYTTTARYSGEVYENPYFEGEMLCTYSKYAELTVLDEFGLWALVNVGGRVGYTYSHNMSSSAGYSGGTSGGGGGTTGGGGGNTPGGGGGTTGGGGTSGDGGDISLGDLGFTAASYEAVELATYDMGPKPGEFVSGVATVLADGVEAYLFFISTDAVYMVVDNGDDTRTIFDGKNTVTVPSWAVYLDDYYEVWDGSATSGAEIYDNYRFIGGKNLARNTAVTVIFSTGNYYVVTVDGKTGYMMYSDVSDGETYVDYSGGGNTSGGGGGGNTPSGGDTPGGGDTPSGGDTPGGGTTGGGQEWTDPVF